MSLTTLVLADGQTTPVDHNFVEVSEYPIATWSERTGISIGEPVISIMSSRPTKTRRSHKTNLRIMVPVLETISGDVGGYTPQPRVAFTSMVDIAFISPDRTTAAQRADLYAFAQALLSKEMVKQMVVNQLPAA